MSLCGLFQLELVPLRLSIQSVYNRLFGRTETCLSFLSRRLGRARVGCIASFLSRRLGRARVGCIGRRRLVWMHGPILRLRYLPDAMTIDWIGGWDVVVYWKMVRKRFLQHKEWCHDFEGRSDGQLNFHQNLLPALMEEASSPTDAGIML